MDFAGLVVLAGEISSRAAVDMEAAARRAIREIGYVHDGEAFHADRVKVLQFISKQFVIDDVKARLTQLVTMIHRMVPTARIGVVVYRDRGDDYVVKWTDLSFRTEKLRDFLSVRGRHGQPCQRCGTKIRTARVHADDLAGPAAR